MSTEKNDVLELDIHPLEVWRLAKGYSVSQVAGFVQTSRNSYYRILGGAIPRDGLAKSIETLTGLSRAQLVEWADRHALQIEQAA